MKKHIEPTASQPDPDMQLVKAIATWAKANNLMKLDPEVAAVHVKQFLTGEFFMVDRYDGPCSSPDIKTERALRLAENLARHGHPADVGLIWEQCNEAGTKYAAAALELEVIDYGTDDDIPL